jgi:hypothetical protein
MPRGTRIPVVAPAKKEPSKKKAPAKKATSKEK